MNPKLDIEAYKTQIAKEILIKNSNTGGITSQHLPSNYATETQQ
jgi:hypothetical protein